VTTRRPIRAVAFDLMDTVVRDPFREALLAATGLSLEELVTRRAPHVYPAFECGHLDEDAYWDHYEEIGVPVDRDAFHRVRRDGISWLPGMRELLDHLDGVVVRATASNYPSWIEELAGEHLGGRFEHVFASCHFGVRKPDPAFYAALLDGLGLARDEVLFVDDRQENVDAAEEAGIHAHRFRDAATVRAWLADRGVRGREVA